MALLAAVLAPIASVIPEMAPAARPTALRLSSWPAHPEPLDGAAGDTAPALPATVRTGSGTAAARLTAPVLSLTTARTFDVVPWTVERKVSGAAVTTVVVCATAACPVAWTADVALATMLRGSGKGSAAAGVLGTSARRQMTTEAVFAIALNLPGCRAPNGLHKNGGASSG